MILVRVREHGKVYAPYARTPHLTAKLILGVVRARVYQNAALACHDRGCIPLTDIEKIKYRLSLGNAAPAAQPRGNDRDHQHSRDRCRRRALVSFESRGKQIARKRFRLRFFCRPDRLFPVF